ncbi:uncharacterized protein [Arachis hypogaea]|uniref:uncharacterized protein isoform X2 n=1 Tax=Arachis hypogaea TaxID=3818 RepID=UPI000DECC37C
MKTVTGIEDRERACSVLRVRRASVEEKRRRRQRLRICFRRVAKMKNNKLEVAVAVGAAARRKNSGTVSGVTTEGAAGNKLTTSVKRMESSEILSSVVWQKNNFLGKAQGVKFAGKLLRLKLRLLQRNCMRLVRKSKKPRVRPIKWHPQLNWLVVEGGKLS